MKVASPLGESPVHVLLLHENDIVALYADDLVTALRKSGWEVVSPDLALARSGAIDMTSSAGN